MNEPPKIWPKSKELSRKKTKFAAAKLKNPERKAQATGAVDDVAQIVPELVAVAKKVAQNPKDTAAVKKLQNLNRVL